MASRDNCLKCYINSILINPNSVIGYNNLSNALLQSGKTTEAYNLCKMVLKLKPDYVKSNMLLGAILLKMGKVKAAHETFENALSLAKEQGLQYEINQIQEIMRGKKDTIKWTIQDAPAAVR